MGCDIHFVLEERTAAGWRFCRCYDYPGADVRSEKARYKKHAAEYQKDQAAGEEELENTGGCCYSVAHPEELVAKQLERLGERDYERFAMLSQAVGLYRAPKVAALPFVARHRRGLAEDDGLPADASRETRTHLGSDPDNRHSHGCFYSKAFVDFDWATKWEWATEWEEGGGRTAREIFGPDVLYALLGAFAQEPAREYRVVYNFDN